MPPILYLQNMCLNTNGWCKFEKMSSGSHVFVRNVVDISSSTRGLKDVLNLNFAKRKSDPAKWSCETS